MKLSFAPLVAIAGLLVSEVQASLNCTVVGQPLEYRSCEYPDCPVVGTYTVGAQIQAACRSDCSSDQNIWYWLYNRYYAQGGARVTGCNYSGIPFAQTGLPYCYQEQNRPRPTTCTRTSFATATPTTTARTTTTSSTTTRTTTNSPTRPTTPPITSTTTTRGNCGSLWSQCGGIGWSGPTCCTSGTCRSLNAYYSQCIN